MEGYACTATLIRQTENGEKIYETKQYYKSTGEYRLELTAPETVAGNYTVFDGDRICQYNPRVNDCIIRDVPESQHRSELFLGQFIKTICNRRGSARKRLRSIPPSALCWRLSFPAMMTDLPQKSFWIDRESLLPVRFVIYDADDKGYRMDYHEFDLPSAIRCRHLPNWQNKHPVFVHTENSQQAGHPAYMLFSPPLSQRNSGV